MPRTAYPSILTIYKSKNALTAVVEYTRQSPSEFNVSGPKRTRAMRRARPLLSLGLVCGRVSGMLRIPEQTSTAAALRQDSAMPAAKGKKKVAPEAAAAVPGRSVAPDADRRCARRAGEQPARSLESVSCCHLSQDS